MNDWKGCSYKMTENHKDLKPVTKWVGGKRQLLKHLNELKPDNYNCYFEPFVGGGAMLFNLAPQKAVINDFNADLINLYKVVKDHPYQLLTLLEHHAENNTKEYYLKIRSLDRSDAINHLSSIEKAARILYMLKVDFNGMYRVNKDNQFNVPYGKYVNPRIADHENIIEVSRYLQQSDVEILNGDFADAVKNAKTGDFVYFDPPYLPLNSTSDFTSYTADGFTLNDQKRLSDLFFELSDHGVYVMVSNSYVPMIEELYQGADIHLVKANRFINSKADKRGKVNEVIITNY
jgi:DNA adenine methylase